MPPTNPEATKQVSWWQTLPGVLTALAAFITAISGLVGLLYQNGFFSSKPEQPHTDQTISQAATSTETAKPDATVNAKPSAKKPWTEMEAVVLGQDGNETRLRADSFSSCISSNHELSLAAGQTVPFEKMANFEVVKADDHTSPNAKAHIKIGLLNGSAVSGTVEANCDLFGYNDIGRYTTYYEQIRSVRFE